MKLIRFLIPLLTIIALILLCNYASQVYQPEKIYPAHFHKTLYLDRNFTDDQVFSLTSAAVSWTEKTNHIAEFDVVQLPTDEKISVSDAIIMVKASPDYPEVMIIDRAIKGITLGYYNDSGLITYILLVSDRIDEDFYTSVSLHELGHSLGLEHNKGIEGIGTLMYPSADFGADVITNKDVENFCKLYKCDPEKLKH